MFGLICGIMGACVLHIYHSEKRRLERKPPTHNRIAHYYARFSEN